ncbi:hypothetical protein D3H35_07665 [Cohnella faecalis]|uniref:Nucleoside recognition domain-containing protein n=2 Tax=Cohnella faecalis TaxID=2315694 RepID=A0A398CPU2_9BACL|nr:hypothetical protein D3H35_07665 [Cohnella faecalis]
MTQKQTQRPRSRMWPKLLSIALGTAALLTVFGIVRAPGEAFRASLSGLQIWWQYVFPGLIPPLVLAELLAASGLLHGLSMLAEPLTRRLFRLPGASGWAIAFGWSTGVPAGAKEAARLRGSGLIREEDTDTLLLVSHMPNPFLVIVIVGSGFLQSPALGWAIALGLWLSAAAAGIVWSRLAKSRTVKTPPLPVNQPRALMRRALRAAADARKEDGRPFGKQMADAVSHSIATLMVIGGLMMLSAVALQLIRASYPGTDVWLAIPGVYEMHLGAYETGHSMLFASAPVHAASLLAAALAWTGWSGLLQARAAFGTEGSFPWGRVIGGRLLHSALAMLFTWPLAQAVSGSGWLARFFDRLSPSSVEAVEAFSTGSQISLIPDAWRHIPEMWLAGLLSFGVFLLLALLAALIRPARKQHKQPPRPPSDHTK